VDSSRLDWPKVRERLVARGWGSDCPANQVIITQALVDRLQKAVGTSYPLECAKDLQDLIDLPFKK
jgi:hypothetical protein